VTKNAKNAKNWDEERILEHQAEMFDLLKGIIK